MSDLSSTEKGMTLRCFRSRIALKPQTPSQLLSLASLRSLAGGRTVLGPNLGTALVAYGLVMRDIYKINGISDQSRVVVAVRRFPNLWLRAGHGQL